MSRLLALLLPLALVPMTASAQDEFLSEFHFTDLKFEFYPAGLENKQESDGQGSAIMVKVNRVRVEDWNALDLRHCIDGDGDWCEYTIPGGNDDGTVTAAEVASFQSFAIVGLRTAVPKVNDLLTTLKNNITVDGVTAKRSTLTKVVFEGAEGSVDNNATIIADIEAKVTYDNDGGAKSHVIHLATLSMKPEGFYYQTVTWKVIDAEWTFDAAKTKPDGAKTLVNSLGYYSTQDVFEALTAQGLEFAVQEGSPPSGKKSPGLGPVALLAGLAVSLALVRRK